MGRKRHPFRRGVTPRTYKSGKRAIQIQFSYRGVTCREILPGFDPEISSHRAHANNVKAEVEARKVRGSFVYEEFFPESKKLRLFGRVVSTVTVKEAQESILKDLRRSGSKEKQTIKQYEREVKIINSHIGEIRIVDLTPDHIRDIIRERQITRKTFSNYTIVLNKALRRAVGDGEIASNPIDRAEVKDLFPIRDKVRPDPFSMAEIEQILTTAEDFEPLMWNLAEFVIFSGPRIEEFVALLWPDVDLKTARVKIQRAAMINTRSTDTKRVKTPSGRRDLDLLPRALAALKRQREETGWHGEWVWRQFTRNAPFRTYDQINTKWRTLLKRAGVRYRPFKQTRHTFASHQLSSGINRLLVAYQMGHSDTSKLDIYGAWVDDWKEEHEVAFGYYPGSKDENTAIDN